MNQTLKKIAHGLSIAKNFRCKPLTQDELIGWNRSVYYIASEFGLRDKELDKFYKACDGNRALTQTSKPD